MVYIKKVKFYLGDVIVIKDNYKQTFREIITDSKMTSYGRIYYTKHFNFYVIGKYDTVEIECKFPCINNKFEFIKILRDNKIIFKPYWEKNKELV